MNNYQISPSKAITKRESVGNSTETSCKDSFSRRGMRVFRITTNSNQRIQNFMDSDSPFNTKIINLANNLNAKL